VTDDPIEKSEVFKDLGGNDVDLSATHDEFTSLRQGDRSSANDKATTTDEGKVDGIERFVERHR